MIWVLAYLIGFIATGIAVIRFEYSNHENLDADDQVIIGIQGVLGGLMWPLVVLGYGLYRIATHNTVKDSK